MLELFLSAFITLFVVIDPPGCAPIYIGLTTGASEAQRRSMALRATLIAGAILLLFALFGEELLAALHIELDAFRMAGGIMLFLIALDMVFEKRTQRREARAESVKATPEIEASYAALVKALGPDHPRTISARDARAEVEAARKKAETERRRS